MVFKTPFSCFSRLCHKTRNWHSELSKVNTGNSFYISITPTSFKRPGENGTLIAMPKRDYIKIDFSWAKDTFWIKSSTWPRNPSCLTTPLVNLGELSEGPVQPRCVIFGYMVICKSCKCTCKLRRNEMGFYIVTVMEWNHPIPNKVNGDGVKFHSQIWKVNCVSLTQSNVKI